MEHDLRDGRLLLGENWEVVDQYAGVLTAVVIAACVPAVIWFVGSRLLRQRRSNA
ncbi:hypothetical protein [Streptosporangium sp. KLBMP 9127]|nr:hypothetical protein [Streptosporangium sp. KLBMP 9127]